MTLPGFTAERSLRNRANTGCPALHLRKHEPAIADAAGVAPAIAAFPTTFAACYELCVSQGASPDDCFWTCILLFPLESGYDYTVFAEDVIDEDAVIDLTGETAAEAGGSVLVPLLGAVAIGLAIGIPAGFILDWAISKPAGSGPTGTTGATSTTPPTCRITGGALYTPPGPVTGCYFGSKRSIDKTIEIDAQAVCDALPAGFCSSAPCPGGGTCKPIVMSETVLSQGWCRWGTSTTLSFQCGCRCW